MTTTTSASMPTPAAPIMPAERLVKDAAITTDGEGTTTAGEEENNMGAGTAPLESRRAEQAEEVATVTPGGTTSMTNGTARSPTTKKTTKRSASSPADADDDTGCDANKVHTMIGASVSAAADTTAAIGHDNKNGSVGGNRAKDPVDDDDDDGDDAPVEPPATPSSSRLGATNDDDRLGVDATTTAKEGGSNGVQPPRSPTLVTGEGGRKDGGGEPVPVAVSPLPLGSGDGVAPTTDDPAGAAAAAPRIIRPVKRARTAYFIFAEERRSQLAQECPGQSLAQVGKALGALWNALSIDDKRKYQDQAAEERARVARELEEWTKQHPAEAAAASAAASASDAVTSSTDDPRSLVFPVSKVRRICKLDPDVRNVTKEAVALIAQAAELALQKLGRESVTVAALQNRRKLLPDDVALVCETRSQFEFLRDDIADLHRLQQREHQQQQQLQQQQNGKNKDQSAAPPKPSVSVVAGDADHDTGATASSRKGSTKKTAPLPVATKPLTAYFAAKPSKS